MLVLKEVHRIRMISNGVGEASKQHKDNIIIVTLIGCVKGTTNTVFVIKLFLGARSGVLKYAYDLFR